MPIHPAIERSITQFRSNPLRTGLALLGIVFGVGSVVAMTSIGQGAQQEILATIDSMGADLVHVKARDLEDDKIAEIVNDSVGLSRADALVLRRAVPDVSAVGYRALFELGVSDLRVPPASVTVYGASENLFDLHGLRVSEGRALLPADHLRARRVVVLGAELARRAFPDGALRKRVRLQYAFFEVVGVLEDRRSATGDLPIDPEVYDRAVVMPHETMIHELAPPPIYGELDLISLRVPTTAATLEAKRVLAPLLELLHGKADDYELVAPEEILRKREAAQATLNAVLIAIAAISLIVGGIGVMNIMLANIMERVSEIGLRRAVGARRIDIRNQFLAESVTICLAGGVIGLVLGLVISYIVAWAVDLPIAFAWVSMVLSFVIAAGVGILFGIMPALRAADISPIEALQHE